VIEYDTPLIVVVAFMFEIQPEPFPVMVNALAVAADPVLIVVFDGVAVAPGLTSFVTL
jgi:hypothetical protein